MSLGMPINDGLRAQELKGIITNIISYDITLYDILQQILMADIISNYWNWLSNPILFPINPIP